MLFGPPDPTGELGSQMINLFCFLLLLFSAQYVWHVYKNVANTNKKKKSTKMMKGSSFINRFGKLIIFQTKAWFPAAAIS